MRLTSLLVCADAEAIQVLSRICEDLEFEVQCCGNFSLATSRINSGRFAVVLIDCRDETAGADLIAHTRASSPNNSCAVVALLDGQHGVRNVFAAGANFVLYRPISRERAAHCLQAARTLVRRERRLKPRIRLEAEASMAFAGKEDAPALLVNVNELGLGIKTGEKLPAFSKVYFQFTLPGQKSVVRLSGEVMWQDASGRVGIRFANVPPSSRKVLQGWMEQQGASEIREQPLRHVVNGKGAITFTAELGALAGAKETEERRDRGRKTCSLGVDIYRPENPAPMRCTLTDVASGGCYVETTDPFPEGTAVEIVVRTEKSKLCIAGRVRSVNRSFGMGVQFSLRDAEQQGQVQRLVEWAGVGTKPGR